MWWITHYFVIHFHDPWPSGLHLYCFRYYTFWHWFFRHAVKKSSTHQIHVFILSALEESCIWVASSLEYFLHHRPVPTPTARVSWALMIPDCSTANVTLELNVAEAPWGVFLCPRDASFSPGTHKDTAGTHQLHRSVWPLKQQRLGLFYLKLWTIFTEFKRQNRDALSGT